MAEYITANRWITGVATHKTKNGRILCTGFGCIGCFPQDFPETACELEVYDNQTGLLFAESWTNELNNRSVMETISQQIEPAKKRGHFERKNSQNNEFKTEPCIPDGVTVNENMPSGEFKKLFLTECEQETEEGSERETIVETKEIKKENDTKKFPAATEDNSFKEKSSLSLEKLTKHASFPVDRKFVEREDCVLFFALEYNHNSSRLSDFSILEIVNSLTTLMHVNEIKCVQRLDGLWHIVLRTRKHLRYLLTNGMKIRGRRYRIIQDNDLYCEEVR